MSRTHRISLGGLDLLPDLSGALYVPDFKTLLVADLHLEKGSSLARRGLHVPPYDTRASLLQLTQVLENVRPEKLIFLGDSFNDREARARIDDIDLAMLLEITNTVRTIWISGNHDPEPPADVGGVIVSEVALGPITLRHEPRLTIGENCEIAGHLHPAASVEQRGRRIRCRCFIADQRRIVMPAFGSYTGGLSVTAAPYKGLFESFEVFMIGAKAIHRIPGRRVR